MNTPSLRWVRAVDILVLRAFGLTLRFVYSGALPRKLAIYWQIGRNPVTCTLGGIY